jgi:hypothetical protein
MLCIWAVTILSLLITDPLPGLVVVGVAVVVLLLQAPAAATKINANAMTTGGKYFFTGYSLLMFFN